MTPRGPRERWERKMLTNAETQRAKRGGRLPYESDRAYSAVVVVLSTIMRFRAAPEPTFAVRGSPI